MPTTPRASSKPTLAGKLLEIQKDLPSLVKSANNPHFGNAYVPLDAVLDALLPVLNDAGILLMQTPGIAADGQPTLDTTLHLVETGEELRTSMLLMLDKNNPQGQGSGITYARRYVLMPLFGLVGDADDDGNAASFGGQKYMVPEGTQVVQAAVAPRGEI